MALSPLAVVRQRRNLTQRALADHLHTTSMTISRIERGEVPSALLGASIVLLLGRSLTLEEVCFGNGMDAAVEQYLVNKSEKATQDSPVSA